MEIFEIFENKKSPKSTIKMVWAKTFKNVFGTNRLFSMLYLIDSKQHIKGVSFESS
jgi:hypothetical protein